MRRKAASALILLCLGLGLSACGGGEALAEVERTAQASPEAKSAPSPRAPAAAEGPAQPAPEGWAEDLDGLWSRARRNANGAGATSTDEDLRALENIGYAGGFVPAPDPNDNTLRAGVTVHDKERAQPGLNLWTSGHAPEAVLADMNGQPLHTWRYDYARLPDARTDVDRRYANTWRRVRLFPDGSLLAIYEGIALVKLDRDSKLVWSYTDRPHHDLDVADGGAIYVLARRAGTLPRIHATKPVLEDFIAVLDADGHELKRVSVVECIENSEYPSLLERRAYPAGDILHTNTLEILDGTLEKDLPAFRRGNVLISMRHNHALAVLNLESKKVVWAAFGSWRMQHDPRVLPSGNLLLFDNGGNGGFSQVLELNLRTNNLAWAYRGTPPESFFSLLCGASQRLANGNTLITETCQGRAFEVTPQGEKVWEYVNPERAGEEDELIAALFEVERLPLDATAAWLEVAPDGKDEKK